MLCGFVVNLLCRSSKGHSKKKVLSFVKKGSGVKFLMEDDLKLLLLYSVL